MTHSPENEALLGRYPVPVAWRFECREAAGGLWSISYSTIEPNALTYLSCDTVIRKIIPLYATLRTTEPRSHD